VGTPPARRGGGAGLPDLRAGRRLHRGWRRGSRPGRRGSWSGSLCAGSGG
jgi:hypothetical protein